MSDELEPPEDGYDAPPTDNAPNRGNGTGTSDGVPIERLEALADEWEERSDRTTGHGTKSSAAYHRCTGDLRDLMEEHR